MLQEILERMPKLKSLDVAISTVNLFEICDGAFSSSFPNVVELTVAPHCHSLITAFQNLSVLRLGQGHSSRTPRDEAELKFLRVALTMDKLTELQVFHGWELDIADCVFPLPVLFPHPLLARVPASSRPSQRHLQDSH